MGIHLHPVNLWIRRWFDRPTSARPLRAVCRQTDVEALYPRLIETQPKAVKKKVGWVQMEKKAGLGCVLGGKTGFGVTRKRGVHEEQCWNWCEQQVLLGCSDRRNTRETNWLDAWYVMGIGRAC